MPKTSAQRASRGSKPLAALAIEYLSGIKKTESRPGIAKDAWTLVKEWISSTKSTARTASASSSGKGSTRGRPATGVRSKTTKARKTTRSARTSSTGTRRGRRSTIADTSYSEPMAEAI